MGISSSQRKEREHLFAHGFDRLSVRGQYCRGKGREFAEECRGNRCRRRAVHGMADPHVAKVEWECGKEM